jgi:hypothetical protein
MSVSFGGLGIGSIPTNPRACLRSEHRGQMCKLATKTEILRSLRLPRGVYLLGQKYHLDPNKKPPGLSMQQWDFNVKRDIKDIYTCRRKDLKNDGFCVPPASRLTFRSHSDKYNRLAQKSAVSRAKARNNLRRHFECERAAAGAAAARGHLFDDDTISVVDMSSSPQFGYVIEHGVGDIVRGAALEGALVPGASDVSDFEDDEQQEEQQQLELSDISDAEMCNEQQQEDAQEIHRSPSPPAAVPENWDSLPPAPAFIASAPACKKGSTKRRFKSQQRQQQRQQQEPVNESNWSNRVTSSSLEQQQEVQQLHEVVDNVSHKLQLWQHNFSRDIFVASFRFGGKVPSQTKKVSIFV